MNLEWEVYPHCTTAGLDVESPQQKAEKHIMNTYPFPLLFSPLGHKTFLRWPAPFQAYPSLKEDWRNPDWFLGTTLASSVRSQHNSANFTVRRCWKMGKRKELAAFMKFFWKHKSVPSVHCEQLNPFHYRKKDEVIFWWAKKKSVVQTLCLHLRLFRNWFCCAPERSLLPWAKTIFTYSSWSIPKPSGSCSHSSS